MIYLKNYCVINSTKLHDFNDSLCILHTFCFCLRGGSICSNIATNGRKIRWNGDDGGGGG